MNSPRAISLLFLVLLLCVASALYYPRLQADAAKKAQLAAVLSGTEAVALDARTKSSDCATRGALPDHACTPGAVFSDLTLSRMCTPGYTKTVRNVSTKLKRLVYAEYGVPYPQPFGSYEADHLIPLAIGGSNDIANLFPEAAQPSPGFKEKDLVEVYLQGEVCAGRVTLAVAQQKIAAGWLAIYNNLPQETLTALKAKYRSWSN